MVVGEEIDGRGHGRRTAECGCEDLVTAMTSNDDFLAIPGLACHFVGLRGLVILPFLFIT